jgi:hypothetical protein
LHGGQHLFRSRDDFIGYGGAKITGNFQGGLYTDIGCDQRGFNFIQQVFIYR